MSKTNQNPDVIEIEPAKPGSLERAGSDAPDCCAEWTRSGAVLNFKARNYDLPSTEETAPPFLFCPWCGRARHNDESSATARKGDTNAK